MSDERKRKPRFSEREVDIMVERIYENADILFSRFSDTLTSKKKKIAWGSIVESVNATSFVHRTTEEVKKKWEDLKRVVKRRAAEVRKDRSRTGGGPSSVEPLSSTEELVVSLLGEARIYGLADGVDCFTQQLGMEVTI